MIQACIQALDALKANQGAWFWVSLYNFATTLRVGLIFIAVAKLSYAADLNG
jgi:hypothetical protein